MDELQRLLILGLKAHGLNLDDTTAISMFLKTKKNKMDMLEFLLQNEKLTEQEIMNEMGRIIEQNGNKIR